MECAWFQENELQALGEQLKKQRILPAHVSAIAELMPADISVMNNMRTLVSAFSSLEFARAARKTRHLR
ncbi:MAG TPA: hypothetical protein VLQ20_09965 [Planococcus sp. (in: firmicutes)]|nr:hypothetical protein [Planococcus sp. (in: firmicutes)]